MVKCKVNDNFTISINSDTEFESAQLVVSFTKKIRNYRFRTRNNKWWDGSIVYLKNGKLPIGFWYRIKTICNKYGFKYGYEGIDKVLRKIDRREVRAFCLKLMEGHPKITPRDDQIKALCDLLSYRYCMGDLSTSAGKTLIIYMYIQYLRWKKESDRFLIVDPDADLVMQTYASFEDYSMHMSSKPTICMVHGGESLQSIDGFSIAIGNFQTLSNRDKSFFEGVRTVIVDEGHRAKNKSISYIVDSCTNATSRIGVSGTLVVDNSADYYSLEALLGPIVTKITKREMMDAGAATPIHVEIKVLSYLPTVHRQQLYDLRKNSNSVDGSKIYDIECKMARSSEARLNYIANLAIGLDGNCIIFFKDKKYGYGKSIVDRIKQNTRDKTVFYVDGDTPKNSRKAYMAHMEKKTGVILVANWQVFGTGKSINNLKYAIVAEGQKSHEQVGQALGRLMRLHESMEKAIWIDIVDDFRHTQKEYDGVKYVESTNNNILYRHMKDRISIYEKDKLPYTVDSITLTEFTDLI